MSTDLSNPNYFSQLTSIKEIYANKYKQETYKNSKINEEKQRKEKYLEFVKNQINGYLSNQLALIPDQIVIIIRAMIDLLMPLDDTDRQELFNVLSDFAARFNNCLPFIDFSQNDSKQLIDEIEMANALLLSMNIFIQLSIEMNTSYDNLLANLVALAK